MNLLATIGINFIWWITLTGSVLSFRYKLWFHNNIWITWYLSKSSDPFARKIIVLFYVSFLAFDIESLLWGSVIFMKWHLVAMDAWWVNRKIVNKIFSDRPNTFTSYICSFLSSWLIWKRLFDFLRLTLNSHIQFLIHLFENKSSGCYFTWSVCWSNHWSLKSFACDFSNERDKRTFSDSRTSMH